LDANVFTDDGSTLVLTTLSSNPASRDALRRAGVGVQVVADVDGRVDLAAGLACLRELGMEVVLVEGGATLVTALLAGGLVDRLVVAVAPILLGSGVDSVGDLGIRSVADGLALSNRTVAIAGGDLIVAGDVGGRSIST
jgi:diaminohydroxyphosphoribosylaminopyrimidine deaminase/5-amino-6-(5-phosphoribosylamino)uracil reductase